MKVIFISQKKTILSFLLIIFIFSFIAEGQWVQQYKIGSNDIALDAIQFINENTGFAVGEEASFNVISSVFLKTTNGGINWNRLSLNVTNNHWLYALSFINAEIGYVCGRTPNIRKTTDGGISWSNYPITTNTPNFNAVQFLNEQTGYIGGRYGMLAKTTNGGISWFSLDSAFTHINAMCFFDINTGFIADAYSGIYKTTNAGINWNYQFMTDSSSGYAFLNMSFANANTGYIVGSTPYSGTIVKTTNAGITWKTLKNFPYQLLSVCALNNSNVYVGGQMSYILYSTNAGLTWSNQPIPTAWGITSIFFTNSNTGFLCVGDEIYRTTNAGIKIENISSEIPNDYMLYQNFPNPFNSSTKLKFAIKRDENVFLSIFDINGKEVFQVTYYKLKAGIYEIYIDLSNLSSGIYFCRMRVNNIFKRIRLMLVK